MPEGIFTAIRLARCGPKARLRFWSCSDWRRGFATILGQALFVPLRICPGSNIRERWQRNQFLPIESQFSALLDLQPKSDRIQDALAYVKKNLEKDLSVEVLAEAAQLSPRQFSRAFRAETGQSPPRRWRTCVSRRCV